VNSSHATGESGSHLAWRAGAVAGAVALGAVLGLPAIASAATSPQNAATPQVIAGPQAAAAAHATLALKADTALPYQAVHFTAGGFKAGERVTLHWGTAAGSKLATVTVNKSGKLSGSFHVPLPRGGVTAKVELTAVGASSGRKAVTTFTQGCTDEWTHLSGGNWTTAADWSTGSVPGANPAACITLRGAKNYTVVLDEAPSTTLGSLQVGAEGGKTTQTLALNAGRNSRGLRVNHTSTVHKSGELELTSAGSGGDYLRGSGTLLNYGLLVTKAGKGPGRFLNEDIVNEAGGKISVAAGTTADGGTSQGYSTLVNKGTIDVAKGSEYDVAAGATLDQVTGTISNSGLVQVSGTVEKRGGTSAGNVWHLGKGAVLRDKAGRGAYEFLGSGTISGLIPAGQTVTVNADIALALDGNVTNDGTLVLNSTDDSSGGDVALTSTASAATAATLFNYGRLLTQEGTGGARNIEVDVTNETTGAVDLAAAVNQLAGGLTFANSGTLNIGGAAALNLNGDSDGGSSLIEKPTATTNITLNTTSGAHSTIDQGVCAKAACKGESVQLGGTLNVSKSGTGKVGQFVPVISMQSKVSGKFAHATVGIGTSYNGPGSLIPNIVGDLILTLP
jgi:hypothetical protein